MPRTQLRVRCAGRSPAPLPPPSSGTASELPAPAPCVTLVGTSHYRTFDGGSPHTPRTRRSSRGERSKKFSPSAPCDGPRAAVPRDRQKPRSRLLRRDGRDTGGPVPDAAAVPPRFAGTAAPHATETNAERPGYRPGCNTGSAGGQADTDARTPSAGNAGPASQLGDQRDVRYPLDAGTNSQHAEMGPREGLLPKGQASERSVNFSPRRS
jgi:hypothetical protein